MSFKVGDRVICIDNAVRTYANTPKKLAIGDVYTVSALVLIDNSLGEFPGIKLNDKDRTEWIADRFILACEITKLERIIYGLPIE